MCKDIWSELRIGGLSEMLKSSLKVVGEQLMNEFDWFSNNDYSSTWILQIFWWIKLTNEQLVNSRYKIVPTLDRNKVFSSDSFWWSSLAIRWLLNTRSWNFLSLLIDISWAFYRSIDTNSRWNQGLIAVTNPRL